MMSDGKWRKVLGDWDLEELRQQARSKLTEHGKLNDRIGDQIFALLSLYARVLYYPLEQDGPWGFVLLKDDRPFVAINTAIPVDKQIFAAAHELYHIWFDQTADYIPSTVLSEIDEHGAPLDPAERKANRFAAEFLVEEGLLKQEMHTYDIMPGRVMLKDVLVLANLFSVPYETMVKRLCETNAITEKEQAGFLAQTPDMVNKFRRRFALPIPEADHRIALDNFIELAVKQYEKKNITFERLAYLLDMTGLDPESVGIIRPVAPIPASDEELDRIMEE